MNPHDGGIRLMYFTEPLSVANRFYADQADLPLLVAASRARQDRQRAEARAGVDRLLESVFEDADGR